MVEANAVVYEGEQRVVGVGSHMTARPEGQHLPSEERANPDVSRFW